MNDQDIGTIYVYICLYRYQVIYTIDDKFNLLSVVADQGFDFRCGQP